MRNLSMEAVTPASAQQVNSNINYHDIKLNSCD